jgi:hypothetical protein
MKSDMPGMSESMTADHGPLLEGPHMRMTALAKSQPGDSARAAAVLTALRTSVIRYADYHTALGDGFRIFAPRVPQHIYHFTSWRRGFGAIWHFDPAAPTSLLYEKTGDSSYRLVGAMYTAPRTASLESLNDRIPLSIAQWHVHTNICVPRARDRARWAERDSTGRPVFGPGGSIATESACNAANGRFIPQIYGWMIHVYPNASDWPAIWGRGDGHGM